MLTATENLEFDLSHWAPGTRFFSTSDDKHMVVDADTTEYPTGPTKYIRRDTAVLYCNPDATVTDLVPDHVFAPGTTAEQALQELGYEIAN